LVEPEILRGDVMPKGRIYRHDATEWVEIEPLGPKWGLRELQLLVGGYIQTIPVSDGTLVLDEDGRLKGKPLNPLLLNRYGFPCVGAGVVVMTGDIG